MLIRYLSSCKPVLLTSLVLYVTIWHVVECSSGSSNHAELLEAYGKHNYGSHKENPCGKDSDDFKVDVRRFYPARRHKTDEFVRLMSNESLPMELFRNLCGRNESYAHVERDQSHEIIFKYKFYESLHCLRIQFELANSEAFTKTFGYGFYRFSYREFTHPNTYLATNKLEPNETNRLIIRHVNLRPYVICVSFYKNMSVFFDYPSGLNVKYGEGNDTLETTPLDCAQMSNQLLDDPPVQDIHLCIDIDTPEHFMEAHKDSAHYTGTNRELVMVLFIVVLLVIVLTTIAFINFLLVEKPLKERRQRLRAYLQRHLRMSTDPNSHLLSQSHDSLHKRDASHSATSPCIVVTDYSTRNSASNSVINSTSSSADNLEETEALLANHKNHHEDTNGHSSNGSSMSHSTSNDLHKPVTFHVGETIIEEPDEVETLDEIPSFTANPTVKADTKGDADEKNLESVRSVSHLLDDKPWLSSNSNLVSMTHIENPNHLRQTRSSSLIHGTAAAQLPTAASSPFGLNNQTANGSAQQQKK